MRIAYLTQPYPPMVSGAAIVAEQLAKAMANLGHEVLVIAASESGSRYTVKQKNLTVLRLTSVHNPLRVGQRVMFFPRISVLKALKEFQPDVIHAHEPVQMGSLGLRYAKHAGIPITMTTHQLPWFLASYLPNIAILRTFIEKIIWKYAQQLAARFTTIISPTKTIANVIKARTGLKPTTINYGVDLQIFIPPFCNDEGLSLRTELNIPASAPIILHAGRLDTDKCVDRVILAAAIVIKRSDTHLLIAGDGCQKSELVLLCESLGIETRVHFLGFISHKDELAKIYRTSDVFVTASEIETQGIVLVEAAACGLPIVAVNSTCIPEVVHDGINGYLADSGDILGLSSALEKIITDKAGTKLMKVKSRFIAENYDMETSFLRHEKLYQNIVKQIAGEKISMSNQSFRKTIKKWAGFSG